MDEYKQLLEENYEKYIQKKKKIKAYYVIQEGINKGIYYSWNEIKEKIINKSINYKKFTKKQDAVDYLNFNYSSEDLVLCEEEIAKLSYNNKEIYNVDTNKSPFNIDKLNKNIINNNNDNNSYIFISGKSKKIDKLIIESTYSIFFGLKLINISDKYNSNTDIPYLLAIEFIVNQLDKNKKQIKEFQKENINNIIYIVIDDTYNYNLFKYWIHKWSKTNWKTKREEDILNKNMIKNIYFIMSKLKLHKIRYDFKFINPLQLPPSCNKQLETFLWKQNLYSKYLLEI